MSLYRALREFIAISGARSNLPTLSPLSIPRRERRELALRRIDARKIRGDVVIAAPLPGM